MARPRHKHPTPAELEMLQILWRQGPATVRECLDALPSRRRRPAYTSVMSLLNVMAEKGLVRRKREGRAFLYTAAAARDSTLAQMVGDLADRAFAGSTSALVTQLLQATAPDDEELRAIRDAIDAYQNSEEGQP